jgi:hypothetical protein
MNTKVLSKEISKELGESPELIEKVIRSQFKLLWNVIHEGELKSVYLKFLGRWGVKPERIKHFGKQGKFSTEGDTNV